MPRALLRSGLLLLVAVGTAVLTVHAQPPAGTPTSPDPARFEPPSSFFFPEDPDASRQYEAVTDYMSRKAIPWDVVSAAAQRRLDARSDAFYTPKDKATGKPVGEPFSIKTRIAEVVGRFPKDGREFYELSFGPPADTLLKEAVRDGYDRAKLADCAQRYFHTKAGTQATLLLAALDLDAGSYAEAAAGYQRLLARADADTLMSPRLRFKAAVALKRSGDPRQADAALKLWDRLAREFPRDGLVVGRKTYSLDELRTEFDRPPDEKAARGGEGVVAMRYGNPAHVSLADAGVPFLDAAFDAPMFGRTTESAADGEGWVRQHRAEAYKQLDRSRGQVALPGFFPVTAPGLVIYRSYDGVVAVAAKDGYRSQGVSFRPGQLVWSSPTLGGLQTLIGGEDRGLSEQAKQAWKWYADKYPSVVFENAAVGSLSHDGRLVYFVDDMALPPPPLAVAQNLGAAPGGALSRGPADFNRLVAIDVQTGSVKWSLGGLTDTPLTDAEEQASTNTYRLTENALFLGPPLPVSGKLYTLYERGGAVTVACLDPARVVLETLPDGTKRSYPELVWSQPVGAPAVKLSQDPLRRTQPAYLAYADGVLVCPTNSGAVVAVDVNARSLLWARGYASPADQSRMPGGDGVGIGGPGRPFRPRGGFGGAMMDPAQFANGPVQQDRWRAAAPLIAGGRVVLTAHDATQLVCLDLRTGAPLWADARRPDDLYVGGIVDGVVLVVGKDAVRGYKLAGGAEPGKPALAWDGLAVPTPCGHGAAGKDGAYYLPVMAPPAGTGGREPQVWAIDVAKGAVRSRTGFRRVSPTADPRTELGNLVYHDGQMISQSADKLAAFPLIEVKRAEMVRRLEQNPTDPVGLFTRGELSLDSGKVVEAVADFKAAAKNLPPAGPDDPLADLRSGLRQKLYVALTDLLRADFPAGEKHLAEYEALCEVPVDAEEPAEKERLIAEQLRRRGLYLSIVARGREKQGRLADAFDAYRAFAVLGDNKETQPDPDLPSAKILPRVWARGKIDAMMRAASADARKVLDERVQREWAAVKGGNDLARLREFVAVFGPYFPVGREAQLTLADRLIQTHGEDDLRDAQTLLMQVWATADDKPTAAKAVEALARLMLRRGLIEDAVALYAQLADKYPAVVVRDGKTGLDLYGELATDKRVLPYLEPARGPSAARYTIEKDEGPGPRMATLSAIRITPDGDLLPAFRRFQFTLQPAGGGDGRSVIVVADRATGEERFQVADVVPSQTLGAGGAPKYRMAQASGHLVLLVIGANAHCLDLLQKKEVWRRPLTGTGPRGVGTQITALAVRDGGTDDGDLEIKYDDGWVHRLGRAAVLQPTYAAFVTRDGLAVVDPATGLPLWERTNLSPRVQIFGDALHLFLVEDGTSRVLRASDGVPVEGVQDFSTLYTGRGRLAVLGRHLLLTDGDRAEPQRVRLYDPLAGRDVWSREFPARSLVLTSRVPGVTGCLTVDGGLEVLDAATGAVLARGAVDPDRADEHLRTADGGFAVSRAVLLADADRFYLLLNRPAGQVEVFGGGRGIMPGPSSSFIRTEPVSGPVYAFDRATGRRLWYTDSLLVRHNLVLDRFDDLPVLVGAGDVRDERSKATVFRVVVLDKASGRVKYLGAHAPNVPLAAVVADPKTRAVEFQRYDFRIRIAPADEPAVGRR
ncbi:MAG: PQQ-binding-like beta-propeller repeat protein [Gemmataceae bacterium]